MRNRRTFCLLCSLWMLLDGCVASGKQNQSSQVRKLLSAVSNDKIEFVTTRGDRASLPTASRRVVVTGPPEVVKLISLGDVGVLEQLVNLLRDPKRAWAAEVVLASLTGHEASVVNAFTNQPAQWQESMGQNAYERWSEWLKSHRDKLRWDAKAQAFVESSER